MNAQIATSVALPILVCHVSSRGVPMIACSVANATIKTELVHATMMKLATLSSDLPVSLEVALLVALAVESVIVRMANACAETDTLESSVKRRCVAQPRI
jgi:hypothetical protein